MRSSPEKIMSGIYSRQQPSGYNTGQHKFKLMMCNNGEPITRAGMHAYCHSIERAQVEAMQLMNRLKDGELYCDEVLVIDAETNFPILNFAREC